MKEYMKSTKVFITVILLHYLMTLFYIPNTEMGSSMAVVEETTTQNSVTYAGNFI
jgi:hypothetical protein